MLEKMGELHGINIFVLRSQDNREYSHKELEDYLSNFKTIDALSLIGLYSHKILESGRDYKIINNVPILQYTLLHIAHIVIINSGYEYLKREMRKQDLLKALDMRNGLSEPADMIRDPIFLKIRLMTQQFEYTREMRNALPRYLYMFFKLWRNEKYDTHIDLDEILGKIVGLNFEEIVSMGYEFSNQTKEGYFRFNERISDSNKALERIFTIDKQMKFIRWISGDYKEISEYSRHKNSDSKLINQYSFNPLVKFPVVVPDTNPDLRFPQVYIVPISRILIERVTRGLFFDFADFYERERGQNDFRAHFGLVFQEYVGVLLKKCISNALVKDEFSYIFRRSEKKSIDWIVIDDNRAVFIEVKQSSLSLKTRLYPKREQVQKDIEKILFEAIRQLKSFEDDIKNNDGRSQELNALSSIGEIERLIVTHDDFYLANSDFRDICSDNLVVEIPADFHWHVISISELEYSLNLCDGELFEFLKNKRIDEAKDGMSFRDYYAREYKGSNKFFNPFLDQVRDEFFNKTFF